MSEYKKIKMKRVLHIVWLTFDVMLDLICTFARVCVVTINISIALGVAALGVHFIDIGEPVFAEWCFLIIMLMVILHMAVKEVYLSIKERHETDTEDAEYEEF